MRRILNKIVQGAVRTITSALLHLSPRTYFAQLRIRGIEQGADIKNTGHFVVLVVFQKYGVGAEISQLIAAFAAKGYNIVLVSNLPIPAQQRQSLAHQCFAIIQRHNVGHDFGAYKDGLDYLLARKLPIDRLVLMNDSIVPTPHGLERFIDGLASITEFGGATESFRPVYHIQSYCLCFSGHVVSHAAFQKFWRAYRPISNRHYAINNGEIRLSKRLLGAGITARALYTHDAMAAQLMEWDADHLYFLNVFLDDQFIRNELDRYRKIFLDLAENSPDLPAPVATAQHDRRILRRSYQRLAMAKRLAVKRRAVDYILEYLSRRSTVHHAGFLFMESLQFPFVKRNLCRNGIYTHLRAQEALRVIDIGDRRHITDCLKASRK